MMVKILVDFLHSESDGILTITFLLELKDMPDVFKLYSSEVLPFDVIV